MRVFRNQRKPNKTEEKGKGIFRMKQKGKKIGRIGRIFLALLLVVTLIPVTGGTTVEAKSKVAVSKVSITKPSGRVLTLAVGKNFQMKVKVTPSKATNKKVSYQSANSKIAKVNKTGKITARKKGTTKITVKAKDGSGKKATLTVKVIIPVKKVTFTAPSKSTITLTKGKTYQLKTKVTPSNATIKKLKYSSSKKSLATVNSKGKVTLKKAGTVKITAKTTDGSVKKAVCTIKIKNPKPDPDRKSVV